MNATLTFLTAFVDDFNKQDIRDKMRCYKAHICIVRLSNRNGGSPLAKSMCLEILCHVR